MTITPFVVVVVVVVVVLVVVVVVVVVVTVVVVGTIVVVVVMLPSTHLRGGADVALTPQHADWICLLNNVTKKAIFCGTEPAKNEHE